jgi:hypothetical protein
MRFILNIVLAIALIIGGIYIGVVGSQYIFSPHTVDVGPHSPMLIEGYLNFTVLPETTLITESTEYYEVKNNDTGEYFAATRFPPPVGSSYYIYKTPDLVAGNYSVMKGRFTVYSLQPGQIVIELCTVSKILAEILFVIIILVAYLFLVGLIFGVKLL